MRTFHVATLVLFSVASAYDDFHYPSEEATEAQGAALCRPRVIHHPDHEQKEVQGPPSLLSPNTWALLQCPGSGAETNVSAPGGVLRCGACTWVVEAAWTQPVVTQPVGTQPVGTQHAQSLAAVVLDFRRWGQIAILNSGRGADTVLRKSVGQLSGIEQPRFNLSDQFFADISNQSADVLSSRAAALTADGEVDFPSMAAQLAPQRDTVAISHAADVTKFVVTHAGRVKCASAELDQGENSTTGGILELQDLHAPPPDKQKVVFDPSAYLSFWPRAFEHMKTGLVGRHLGVANVGGFTSGSGGFETMSFGPVPPQEPGGVPPPIPYRPVVTVVAPNEGSASLPSLPRLPNVNYRPTCFVSLRSEGSGNAPAAPTRYFFAANDTTVELSGRRGAALFYAALLAVADKGDGLLRPAMSLELPDGDRRQVDMARASLLFSSNTYVGNQPNYGVGATYWSYGREDNGSLPVIVLSVDEALLEWGMCGTALDHIDFYLQNYIDAAGRVTYGIFPWTYEGDSVGDLGRLVELYLRAVRLCRPAAAWQARNLAPVSRIAEHLLRLRARAPALGRHPPGRPACGWGEPLCANCSFTGSPKDRCAPRLGPTGDLQPHTAPNLTAAKGLCEQLPDCTGVTQLELEDGGGSGSFVVGAGAVVQNDSAVASWQIQNLAACRAPGTAGPALAGLVVGPAEHDWCGAWNTAFFDVQILNLAAMERLGEWLTSTSTTTGLGGNKSLGLALLADARDYRVALARSVDACSVTFGSTPHREGGEDDEDGGRTRSTLSSYLPPFAVLNATVPDCMTCTAFAAYSNFDFFSYAFLAQLPNMPGLERAEAGWLELHNARGGRLGGASRFSLGGSNRSDDWLDDMPVAGWGFGALMHNRTQDFLALLYGHAANYQSRGSFWSTEQLAVRGTGRYRAFLHVADPDPDLTPPRGTRTHGAAARGAATEAAPPSPLGYFGLENDVSSCVVSNILVARLTRWQVVMEDARTRSVWLGRGAPRRWFHPGKGFNVSSAPFSLGTLSYKLVVLPHAPSSGAGVRAQGSAEYRVSVRAAEDDTQTRIVSSKTTARRETSSSPSSLVLFSLRWPGALLPSTVSCKGCTVHAEDAARGVVTVRVDVQTQQDFEVRSAWT